MRTLRPVDLEKKLKLQGFAHLTYAPTISAADTYNRIFRRLSVLSPALFLVFTPSSNIPRRKSSRLWCEFAVRKVSRNCTTRELVV